MDVHLRVISSLVLFAVLAACQPRVPDSGLGVSEDAYETYRAEQGRRAAGGLVPEHPVISSERVGTGAARPGDGPLPQSIVDAVERAEEGPETPEGTLTDGADPEGTEDPLPVELTSPPLPEETPPAGAVTVDTDNPGISDTQDFEAVSERRTREQDAARLRAQRENYRMIPAEPLPEGVEVPSVARFALATRHPVGRKMYGRGIFGGLFGEPCEDYATPDDAQLAFLDAGGPERDRLGLDPDGDGYACNWSPEPYRQMLR